MAEKCPYCGCKNLETTGIGYAECGRTFHSTPDTGWHDDDNK